MLRVSLGVGKHFGKFPFVTTVTQGPRMRGGGAGALAPQ